MKYENNQHTAKNRTRHSRWSYPLMILCLTLGVFGFAGLTHALVSDPDINDDGQVDGQDLSQVLSCFGADLNARPECGCADAAAPANMITIADYLAVVGSYGQTGFPTGPNPCVAPPNTIPVADAGPDQTILTGDQVFLDGSSSSDGDGDLLTFSWSIITEPGGSTATLSDPTAVMPNFIANAFGTYVIQLIVNDGTDDSAPDTVSISTDNSPPVADAGPDQSVFVTDTVTLNGGGSSDVDGNSLTFAWSLITVPAGSGATLSSTTAVMPMFDVDLPGTYVAQLIVNDGTVDSAPNTVTITTDNSAPVADAGPDQSVFVTDTVTLDGSASSDADMDPLTYAWSLTTVPAGSGATLSDPAAEMPMFDVDLFGTYVAQLIVNDGTVDSAPDTVTITTDNTAPVADAGPNQNVMTTDTVTLDGNGSSDVDMDGLTFAWSLTTVPATSSASITNPTNVMPTFVPDLDGTYIAQLIVNDGTVNSAPDTVMIDATSNEADLSITKVDDVDPVLAGNTLVYTVTVNNAGPDGAENVVVTDTLPAGVTFVSTTGCAEDPTGVPTCSLGNIVSGGFAQYTITVTVDAGTVGTITNSVSVTSSTSDPNAGNNSTTEDTTVNAPAADLSISKTDDVDPVLAGNTLVYTVTVNNAGPQQAENVVVTDTLPAGVTFVSTTGCAEDAAGVPTCTLGNIASGGNAQYTITVTVDAGTIGTITNSVSVTSDTFDPSAGNNSTTEDTTATNNVAPTINSLATANVDENQTGAIDVNSTDDSDSEGSGLTYSFTSTGSGPGIDNADFGINVNTGVVTFNSAPDFEAPGDDDTNNDYQIQVTVTDSGGLTDFQNITINVDNVNEAPTAAAQAHTVQCNVGIAPGAGSLLTGATDPDAGETATLSMLDAQVGNNVTTQLGNINISDNGAFTYTPPAGFTGPTDTFAFTIEDTGAPSMTDTKTVTFTVNNECIWFVDLTLGNDGTGNGTLSTPFKTLTPLDNAGSDPDGIGDTIFVYNDSGALNLTNPFNVENSQHLIGDGAAVAGTINTVQGFTTQLNSLVLPSTNQGTSPSLTATNVDGISLGTGNLLGTFHTIRGLDIGNTGTGVGIADTGASVNLTIRDVGISGTGGGIEVDNAGTLDVILDSLSSSSSTDEGIHLSNVSGSFSVTGTTGTISGTNVPAIVIDGNSFSVNIDITFQSVSSSNSSSVGISLTDTTGTFTVNGTGTTDGSGGTIQDITARGVELTRSSGITLKNMIFDDASTSDSGTNCNATVSTGCFSAIYMNSASTIVLDNVDITDSAQNAISGNNVTAFSLKNSTVDECGDAQHEDCMFFVGLDGTSSIENSDLSFPRSRAVHILNTNKSLNLTVSGSTFRDNQLIKGTANENTNGEDGMLIDMSGSSTNTINISSSNFLRNRAQNPQIVVRNSSTANVTIQTSTFDVGTGSFNLGRGPELAAEDNASLTFDIKNNPTIISNGGRSVLVLGADNSFIDGHIRNNTNMQGSNNAGGAIQVEAAENAIGIVNVEGNTAFNSTEVAQIRAISRFGSSGRLDITIDNNTITTASGVGSRAINVETQNTNTVCANVINNFVTLTGAPGNTIGLVTDEAAGTILLQGFTTNTAGTWDANGNFPAGSGIETGGPVSAGTCSTPTNP